MRRLRLGQEKDRRKKKPQGKNIVVCPITQGDHKEETADAKLNGRSSTV